MQEVANDIDRNDVIVGAAINRLVANVVQDGFEPQPKTGSDRADAIIAEKWRSWSEDEQQCDSQGESDMTTMTHLAFRAVLVAGDILGNPLQDGSLEMIEAHRIRSGTFNRNANIIHGVELDSNRRRKRYWVTKDDVNPMAIIKKSEMTSLPAYDADGNRAAFHLRMPKRITQTRGITATAPIVNAISQHDDIQFAKLVQQQIVSCWAILREKGPALNRPGSKRQAQSEQTSELYDSGSMYRLFEKISPGMEVIGNEGEKLTGFSPNVPGVTYFDHIKLTLTYIAINLDLPLIVLLMDASETNFSGWRGAWDQAKMRFRVWQRWLVRKWYKPIYEWKVRQWIAADPRLAKLALQNNTDILRHQWETPAWSYIEPMKDATADLLQVRNALNSHRRIQAARGRKWEEVATELTQDNVLAITLAMQAAASVRANFPDELIDWRECLSLPTPDRLSAQWAIDLQGDSEAPTQPEPERAER